MIKQNTYKCAIIQCEKISPDVFLVSLQAPDGTTFKYKSGQYLFVEMSEDDARPYSIASAPGDGKRLQMHIKEIPDNDFTNQVLDKFKHDTHINIRLPSGSCTIEHSSGIKPLLFITGGTGFAHSHPIIHSLLENKDQREIKLYWGANDVIEFYLQDIAQQWASKYENFSFIPVIYHPDGDWTGETGLVHEAVFRNIKHLNNYDIYLSGSSAMVFNIYRQLKDRKVPSSQIFSDMLDILREEDERD